MSETTPVLSRRQALALAAGSAAAAAAAATLSPRRALAHPTTQPHQHTPKASQGSGFYQLSLGNVQVTVLADGTFPFDPPHPTNGTNATEPDFRQALSDAYVPFDQATGHVNALLVNTGKRLILIDAGCGPAFGPTAGLLQKHLAVLGANPADIDTVVLTHLHPDHIGGLLTDAGASWLPNARFVMHETEHAFWSGDTPDLSKTAVPDGMKAGMTNAAQTALKNIGDRVELITDKRTQLDPALALYHCPGHTPGHTLVGLYGDAGQFGYMADLIHFPAVQFANPGWHVAFDVDPEEAADTRARVLAYYAKSRKPLSGSHLPFPAVGHVAAHHDAYALVPAVWQWDTNASAPYQSKLPEAAE
ncbi:MAG: MBL fold metallo-hydrolase [Planctomycetota bacterium]